MKVISAKNSKKPKECAYTEVEQVMIFERHGYKFAVHPSYNKLISCYMFCEYSTGKVFKAYAVPKLDLKSSDIDRVIERVYEYVDTLTQSDLDEALKSLPVVNDDDPEVYSEPSYKDVEKVKQDAKAKEESIKRKFENATKKPVPSSDSTKPKKKRGRPKKKVDDQPNTLI